MDHPCKNLTIIETQYQVQLEVFRMLRGSVTQRLSKKAMGAKESFSPKDIQGGYTPWITDEVLVILKVFWLFVSENTFWFSDWWISTDGNYWGSVSLRRSLTLTAVVISRSFSHWDSFPTDFPWNTKGMKDGRNTKLRWKKTPFHRSSQRKYHPERRCLVLSLFLEDFLSPVKLGFIRFLWRSRSVFP